MNDYEDEERLRQGLMELGYVRAADGLSAPGGDAIDNTLAALRMASREWSIIMQELLRLRWLARRRLWAKDHEPLPNNCPPEELRVIEELNLNYLRNQGRVHRHGEEGRSHGSGRQDSERRP